MNQRSRGFTDNRPAARGREPARTLRSPQRSVTNDSEAYASSVAGVDIDAIRVGPADRATDVVAASSERLTFNAGSVGFPMLSRTTVPDDQVMVAHVSATPPGCRWCEIDLAPGMVLAYSPAAEHTSRSLPGLEFSVVVTMEGHLAEAADMLGTHYETPPRGEVHQLSGTSLTRPVQSSFTGFAAQIAAGRAPSEPDCDQLLRATVHALAEADRTQRIGSTRRIDSRHVVRTCIDYAHSLDRIPSIKELCVVAHVSERRLRTAFTAEFDVPPARYFRLWALDRAHRRFTHDPASNRKVTEIAVDLGLGHLSRFALDYKRVYGETPSATLKRHRESTTGPASSWRHST